MGASIGFDAELQRHNDVLHSAADVHSHDHVLDIGCGTGLTTRQAARAAAAGSALGVDVSARAIERARELARADGPDNVSFEQADAQVYAFPRKRFDLVISRFGTMFFDDPVAAFTNIGAALRPGGRLVMMVWQAAELNEWAVVIRACLESDSRSGDLAGPDAFSLADPPTVLGILNAAGFDDVTATDVHEPVYYGPDVAAAMEWVRGFATVTTALERLGDEAAAAVDRLRDALTERAMGDGVWLDSRAWLVTARRRRAVEGG